MRDVGCWSTLHAADKRKLLAADDKRSAQSEVSQPRFNENRRCL
jgi:hypothetical protein